MTNNSQLTIYSLLHFTKTLTLLSNTLVKLNYVNLRVLNYIKKRTISLKMVENKNFILRKFDVNCTNLF